MASDYDLYPDPKCFLLLDSESTNKITSKLPVIEIVKQQVELVPFIKSRCLWNELIIGIVQYIEF